MAAGGAGRHRPAPPLRERARGIDTMKALKNGEYPKTGERPKAITCADGTTYEASKGQHFQESERGQAWELWQDTPEMRLVKRFPKKRVMWVSE